MADDLQKLTVQIEADISRLEQNLTRANRAIDNKLGTVDRRLTRSERRFQQWGRNIARSIQVGMVAAVAYAGRQALATADRIDVLQDRIKDATRETGDFQKVWAGLSQTAIETGGSIEGNVDLVQRLSIASKDLGATSDDVLKLNDTVQKLGIISGASTSALAAGTTQLAQGLGAGTFRAEEFNSILENIPAVANVMAKNLGKSTAELRNMVLAGQLASKDAFTALLEASEEVEQRYSEIPPRMSRAWGGFLNAISLQVDGINEKFGITESIAQSLVRLTEAIQPTDFSDLPGGQEYNELLEKREEILNRIANNPGRGGAFIPMYQEQLKEVNEQLREFAKRSVEFTEFENSIRPRDKPTPPRATTDLTTSRSDKSVLRNRPDTPDQIAIDRSNEINRLISERTALEALNADMIGRSDAEAERLRLKFEIMTELAKDNIHLNDEQLASMEAQLDLYQQELEMTEEINNELRRKQEQMELLEQASDRFAEDMGRALVDSIASGENALTSLTRAFKAALIRMAADALIINPLKQLFSPSGGNLFGNIFGGFFADGGNPPVGKMSVVGERGPELFIPKTAGTIVSNDNLSKMGGNIKIVNQTTGRIDTVQKTMTRGEVQLILREELPGAMAGQAGAPNSPFNKTFRANNSVSRKF